MADNKKQYEDAMKNLDNLIKKQQSLNKTVDAMKDSWSAVSSEIFKMDGANWFKQVPLASEEVEKLNQTIVDLEKELSVLGSAFDDALNNEQNFKDLAASSSKYFADYEKGIKGLNKKDSSYGIEKQKFEKELLAQMRKDHENLAAMSDEDLKKLTKHIGLGGQLSDVYEDLGNASKTMLISMSDSADEFLKINVEAEKVEKALEGVNKKLEEGQKSTFSMFTGLKNWVGVISKAGISSLMEFDRVINDVQKNTGIAMDQNASDFADITSRVAQFGMTAEKAGEVMSSMSNELDTTNFSVLSKAAEDFAAIEGATGASSQDITTIAGQLMRMGASSGEVKDYMEDASQMAKSFGVNSKKSIEAISKNIGKMRSMGFVGGEESLKKMVITAQKLNQNVDEIFNVADKARNIEGAMEMAAELQLAGGSFSNVNPMELLAAARNSPEELQKILTQMGSDIGKFNSETGKMEFDAIDKDRLQIVADATNQTLDNVMNGIQKTSQDAKKLDPFKGLLDGAGLEDADRALAESSLSDMMKWDKKSGKFQIDADNDLAKKMGITSLEQIGDTELKAMLQKKKDDEKTLEEQNKRNQSFQESLTNFWGALQSIFSVFQPVLEVLTTVMQSVTAAISWLPGWSKYLLAGLMLFSTNFGASVLTFVGQGLKGIKDVFTGNSGVIGMLKNAMSKKSEEGGPLDDVKDKVKGAVTDKLKGAIPTSGESPLDSVTKTAGEAEKIKPEAGSGLNGFVKGLADMSKSAKEISLAGIGKIALSMIMLTAPLGLMAMIFSGIDPVLLLAMGGVLIEQAIALRIMSEVSKGISLSGIMKGALAMGIISLALIPFAFVATQMSGVDWLNVLAGVGILALIALGVAGLGFLLVPIALGTAALVLLSIGLLAFAGTMMLFASASTMMQGMDFSWMSSLGWALLTASPGLLLGGLALLVATPGLILGSLGLMALATAGAVASTVDWNIIAGMGTALLSASGGLIAFSFAALMFANPFALLGMMFMVSSLSALASVMVPLSQSLSLGADALSSFAIGLERLSAAADTISDEKLSKLQKISEAMAKASAAGAVLGAVGNAAESSSGGGGGKSGGGTQKFEIDLKINGRDLQKIILDDTKIVK